MKASEQLRAEFIKIGLKIEVPSDKFVNELYEKFKSGVSLSDIYKEIIEKYGINY